jgi:hypothetical protein
MTSTTLLCALAALSSGGEESPDLLTLLDGKKIECRILYEDAAKVIYRAKRKDVEVPRVDVVDVQSVERNLREFLDRFGKVDRTNAAALCELALFAESHFLPAEAHALWIRVLTVSSRYAGASTRSRSCARASATGSTRSSSPPRTS